MKHLVSFLLIVVCLLVTVSTSPAGQWYPASIHDHSTYSDGGHTIRDLVDIVQAKIMELYSFVKKVAIVVTDHFDGISGVEGGFGSYAQAVRTTSNSTRCVFAGVETGSKWHPEPNTEADAHVLAIGSLPADFANLRKAYDVNTSGKGLPLIEKFDYQQQLIQRILDMGMLPVAAHPTLLVVGGSLLHTDMRFNTKSHDGLRGVEMSNVRDPVQDKGCVDFYLGLLTSGQQVFVTAGSDYHGLPASLITDALLDPLERVTWVCADDFSESAILRAIAQGKTYAANGGAFFTNFLADGGQNPGLAAVGVDKMTITAQCWLTGSQVKIIVYRDGVEAMRQEYKGSSKKALYTLNGGDDFQTGWTDTAVSPGSVHTYVIRAMATTMFGEQTLLITSPITLRLRQPGQTASFFDAIKASNIAAMRTALASDPSLANSRDQREYNLPVHSAKPLALSAACAQGNAETVKLLLEHGAEPDGRLTAGEPGPLMEVAYNGDVQKAALLLDHGADINVKTNSNTPLVWAISKSHTELAKFLIERGADVNLPDENQKCPLATARKNGLTEIVNLLLAHKAKE